MNYLSFPDPISLSGNLRKIIIATASEVVIAIKKGENTLVNASYVPGNDNLIEIDLRSLVESSLSYTFSQDSNNYVNHTIHGSFTLSINGEERSFTAVRAGVSQLADTPANWLHHNFLSWQPRDKKITYYSPEWLTYFAPTAASIKLKATFPDNSTRELSLCDVSPLTAVTVNLQYAVIAGLLGNSYPSYYEVWAEGSGFRSSSQFYSYSSPLSPDEQWFLFENSLGGLDSFRAFGDNSLNAEHTHNAGEVDGNLSEYSVDTARKFTKNTGYLNDYNRRWLLDFFPSLSKYIIQNGTIRQITLTQSNVSYTSNDLPSSYEFTFRFSDTKPLLNLLKNESEIPSELVIPDTESPNFSFPPRLAELPRISLAEGVILPAFSPFNPSASITTLGQLSYFIQAYLYDKGLLNNHIHANLPLLERFSISPDGKLLFDGEPIDSGPGIEDLKGMFLRKDIDDYSIGRPTFSKGLITEGSILSGMFNDSWGDEGEEAPFGFRITPAGHATFSNLSLKRDGVVGGTLSSRNYIAATFPDTGGEKPVEGKGLLVDFRTSTTEQDHLVLRKSGIISGVLTTPYFASGFTGYGTEVDFKNSTAELDFLTVRKSMRVYELVINQIRGTNGSLAVTDTNKIDRVEELPDRWRCYIDTFDGEMFMNFRADDVIRAQRWNGGQTRYWMGRCTSVTSDYFDIEKPMLETATYGDYIDDPAAGDIAIRWSNLSDEDRMGLLYLTSSDSGAPYLDVRHGPWQTDYLNGREALKVRLGRLDGINDIDFGTELLNSKNNFGFYSNNAYLRGNFILRTGENVSTKFTVLENLFSSSMETVRNELNAIDNYLFNASFSTDLQGWDSANETSFLTLAGSLLVCNGSFISQQGRAVAIISDKGLNVLRIQDSYIQQSNSLIDGKPEDPIPLEDGTYEWPTYYITFKVKFKSAGHLTCGFEPTLPPVPGPDEEPLPAPVSDLFFESDYTPTDSYEVLSIPGRWDGSGDFILSYTGECYIHSLSLTTDEVENVTTKMGTLIKQTREQITLQAYRITANESNVAQIIIRANLIEQSVTQLRTDVAGDVAKLETKISQTAESVRIAAESYTNGKLTDYATTTWTAEQITTRIGNSLGNYYTRSETANLIYSELSNSMGNYYTKSETANLVTQTVGNAMGGYSTIEQTDNKLKLYIKSVDLLGKVSEAGFVTKADGNSLWVKGTDLNGQTICSYINQSADTVTIKASKIELLGQVIAFTIETGHLSTNTLVVESGAKIGGFTISGNDLVNSNLNAGINIKNSYGSKYMNLNMPGYAFMELGVSESDVNQYGLLRLNAATGAALVTYGGVSMNVGSTAFDMDGYGFRLQSVRAWSSTPSGRTGYIGYIDAEIGAGGTKRILVLTN